MKIYMMLRFGVKAALILLVFSGPTRATENLGGPQVVGDLWTSWTKKLALAKTLPPHVQILLRDSHTLRGLAGRTRDLKIEINEGLSSVDQQSVFRHELAHVFIEKNFSVENIFFSEVLALALSEDSVRLARLETSFVLYSEAKSYIKDHFETPRPNENKLEAAISKLLESPGNKKKILELVSERPETTAHELLEALIGPTSFEKKGPIHFAIKDLLTHEVIASESNIDQVFSVGSVLKPALVASFPSMMRMMLSRDDQTWACPNHSKELANQRWEWRVALTHSCNGFFLDQQKFISDWAPYKKMMGPFVKESYLKNVETISTAIGLTSGLKLSVREVADFYQWFSKEHTDFIEVLKDTPKNGTLSGQADSKYFLDHHMAMKSGSVRGSDGKPLQGWIVSLIPDEGGEFRFVAVISAPGYSGIGLLSALKQRLKNAKQLSFNKAQVQVLGLLGNRNLEVHCGTNDSFNFKSNLSQNLAVSEIKSGQWFQCLKGPLIVSIPYRDKKLERKYWGRMKFVGRAKFEEGETQATKKEKLARSGSDFIFETSERSYVAHSLASEAATARREVLKALAVIIKNNLGSDRHGERPICDTTHCQLFNVADWLDEAKTEKYFNIYDQVANEPVQANRFLLFSLGGNKDWEKSVSKVRLSEIVDLDDFSHSYRHGNEWRGRKQTLACEKLRGPLHLPSCPDQFSFEIDQVLFKGHGEGHHLGLDISQAEVLAAQGIGFKEILSHFY